MAASSSSTDVRCKFCSRARDSDTSRGPLEQLGGRAEALQELIASDEDFAKTYASAVEAWEARRNEGRNTSSAAARATIAYVSTEVGMATRPVNLGVLGYVLAM